MTSLTKQAADELAEAVKSRNIAAIPFGIGDLVGHFIGFTQAVAADIERIQGTNPLPAAADGTPADTPAA